ncbi:hypothetical protein OH76DRAFT_1364920, partial [Lentinus brumalis]
MRFFTRGKETFAYAFFTRGKETFAYAWSMLPTADKSGWVIAQEAGVEVRTNDFLTSFPVLRETYRHHDLPDPCSIIGVRRDESGRLAPWVPEGTRGENRWRELAKGHRVCAFPMWLFCDDTSGNISKKWNKHNSFLFTAAGLPRRLVHREYNVHFLSTSNTAQPLEMLDGIVDQLLACQTSGVWAWDCELKEMVLLVPSVLAILGDNPMQSEIACHVGMNGKMFCRMCMTSKGQDDDEDDDDNSAGLYRGRRNRAGSVAGSDSEASRAKEAETMADMIEHIKRFMKINSPRTRQETINILKSQFVEAQRVGGQAEYKRVRTETGVRDAYQLHFAERLFRITTQRGVARSVKEAEVMKTVRTIPRAEEGAISPVWRIKDLDPHLDTPVEILHVILLGFVKYFWRDAMSRLKDPDKEKLIIRLDCFDVAGLGFPPLAGATLVNYSGSLVGRDFRALAQVAPFVLHDFPSIPKESIEVWTALSYIIPLVWQPEIDDIDAYTTRLKQAIDTFLDVTCKLTPRWFNKPKFHILLHLPDHIRRFGPAMLFATEGFESFNAVIRSNSIHSNHRAPSRDIALAMAHHNRIRHLLSGGYFRQVEIFNEKDNDAHANELASPTCSPWLHVTAGSDVDKFRWRCAGTATADILALN